MTHKKNVFTRRELHELVWSKPLSELAPILGISDRGLAKICTRHLVPSPPRGYWAKLEAGQPVKITPLRSVGHKPLDRIEIISTSTDISDAARATIQMEAAARLQGIDQAVLLSPNSTQPKLKSVGNTIGASFIQGPVESVHKSLLATAKALRKAKSDESGAVRATSLGQCGVIVHQDRSNEQSLFSTIWQFD
ncbi:hypothetical protein [Phyllobacterium zundukense]|nr:hypothetical protein [Phyllobacterium zundukense]